MHLTLLEPEGLPAVRILQTLDRGLRALDFMHAQGRPVRLTDVAAALGVDKSNASNLLRTLVAAGYADQDVNRRYRSIGGFHRAAGSQHSLEEIVACKEAWRGVLEAVAGSTGECAHLAVRVESRVWYIDKVQSSLPLKVDHPVGSLAPLHCTALGKAFLAFGGAEAVMPLTSYTPATMTSADALEQEIERTRDRGFAVDDEEFAIGIRCVGGPIMDRQGRMIAALSVSGPTVRIDNRRLHELGTIITAHTDGSGAKLSS